MQIATQTDAARALFGGLVVAVEFVGEPDDSDLLSAYIVIHLDNGVRLWADAPTVYQDAPRQPDPAPISDPIIAGLAYHAAARRNLG